MINLNEISHKIANKLAKNIVISEKKSRKLKIGIEIFLENIVKIIPILVCAYFIGTLEKTVIMIISCFMIKRYCYGMHLDNSFACFILTLNLFVTLPYFVCTNLSNFVIFLCFLVFLTLIYIFAPSDTEKAPLSCEKRKKLKKKALISCAILMVLTLLVKSITIKIAIILGILNCIIFILPITYKLFRRRYNNYEYKCKNASD